MTQSLYLYCHLNSAVWICERPLAWSNWNSRQLEWVYVAQNCFWYWESWVGIYYQYLSSPTHSCSCCGRWNSLYTVLSRRNALKCPHPFQRRIETGLRLQFLHLRLHFLHPLKILLQYLRHRRQTLLPAFLIQVVEFWCMYTGVRTSPQYFL